MMMRLPICVCIAVAAASAAALYQPVALPAPVVLARYDGHCGWGRGEGFDRSRYNEADGVIILRYDIVERPYWRRVPVTVPIEYGATDQDEQIRHFVATRNMTSSTYAELCYGEDAGREQLVRAVLARAAQYAEPIYQTASALNWCPLNLPCRVPGTPRAWYRTAEMRGLPRFGNGDRVPVAGAMFTGIATNGFDVILKASYFRYPYARRHFAIHPAHIAHCRSNDETALSYALPTVGVVVHRPNDYAHEMAHYFNFTPADAPTAWKEFLPAYHALKVHAFALGIDLGEEGGWAQYQEQYDTTAKIAALSAARTVSADGVKLLADYLAADEGDELRAWCESAYVGRMVL